MKILVLGGASFDTLIHVESFFKQESQNVFPKNVFYSLGSTGVGKVIPLNKLGIDVIFHAMIGNDYEGALIKKELQSQGVTFLYDIDPKGTEKHVNIMDDEGQRISIYERSATFDPIVNEKPILKAIDESDIILLNIINYTRKFIPYMVEKKKVIWVDIHDYDGYSQYHQDYIEVADVIQMNREKCENFDEFISKMIQKNKMIIVTDGNKGSSLFGQNIQIHQEAIPPKSLVDSNGAGDHFFSGFLFGKLKGLSNEKSMFAGALCATACIESKTISNDIISEDWLLNQLNV